MSRWRSFRRSLLPALAPLVYLVASTIGRTLRLTVMNPPTGPEPKIYAGWHGRSLIATHYFRGQGLYSIISNSRDGEMQNGVFRRFGFHTIRGSSGREGVKAALEAIKALKGGASMAVTPDGPRGPSGVVQPGILMMAAKSGALIVPVGLSAKRCWRVRSWDRFLVPKPFSEAVVVFGDPVTVPDRCPPDELEAVRIQIEHAIQRVTEESDRLMSQVTPEPVR